MFDPLTYFFVSIHKWSPSCKNKQTKNLSKFKVLGGYVVFLFGFVCLESSDYKMTYLNSPEVLAILESGGVSDPLNPKTFF